MFCPVARRHSAVATVGAFSLVEVTIALGVAALCLIVVLGSLPAGLKTQQASVEQTVANGVMTEILGDLRADIRLPPGQASKEDPNNGGSGFGLHGHWLQVRTPDVLYFTNEGKWTGTLNAASPTSDAALRATITYLFPPSASTSVAKIVVSWPPQIDPTAPGTPVPAGFVETFIAVNR
jgi:type II secretory pathway pseudopilin PulG